MNRIFGFLLFVISIPSTLFAQKEKEKIELAIVKFFDGLTDVDVDKLKQYTTSDFILLEHGEIWNMDTLINKISARRNPNFKRVNRFQFIQTEQNGKVAWVSYHNTADISFNERQQTVRWSESAVLRKEKGRWKIKLLHSTRLK